MNAIDFIRESAAYLVKDRPDLYDTPSAVEELSTVIDWLREADIEPVSTAMFSSYVMTRIFDEGMEEFVLSRKLATLVICEADEHAAAWAYTDQINLPDVSEDLDIEDEA